MITFEQADQLIKATVVPLAATMKPLSVALNATLVDSIVAVSNLPGFCNSAMDGFAVCAKDIERANEGVPISLPVLGQSAAGDSIISDGSGQGTAWEVMTGAVVPVSYDCVVPIERTVVSGRDICFRAPANVGANLRRVGEDIKRGDSLVSANSVVTPFIINCLSALGMASIKVREAVHVALIATGDELVSNLDHPLTPGKIRNSNSALIQAIADQSNWHLDYQGQVGDNIDAFVAKVESSLANGAHVVVSTGAVSMGKFDFIPQALRKLNAEIVFHKVQQKPGKPILFARLDNNRYFLGLPGNPVSSLLGIRFYLELIVRALHNRPAEAFMTALLDATFTKKGTFKRFLKARSYLDDECRLWVQVLDGQESFKIKPLIDANCWIILDEVACCYAPGSQVSIAPLLAGALQLGAR